MQINEEKNIFSFFDSCFSSSATQEEEEIIKPYKIWGFKIFFTNALSKPLFDFVGLKFDLEFLIQKIGFSPSLSLVCRN